MDKLKSGNELEIDITDLETTPIHPPRKTLWDLLPVFVQLFCINTLKWQPKPTKYEQWLLKSFFLRLTFGKMRTMLAASAQNVGGYTGNPPEWASLITAPGSEERN